MRREPNFLEQRRRHDTMPLLDDALSIVEDWDRLVRGDGAVAALAARNAATAVHNELAPRFTKVSDTQAQELDNPTGDALLDSYYNDVAGVLETIARQLLDTLAKNTKVKLAEPDLLIGAFSELVASLATIRCDAFRVSRDRKTVLAQLVNKLYDFWFKTKDATSLNMLTKQ